jgi:hypothetical protein
VEETVKRIVTASDEICYGKRERREGKRRNEVLNERVLV